jgi:hypothetical protein
LQICYQQQQHGKRVCVCTQVSLIEYSPPFFNNTEPKIVKNNTVNYVWVFRSEELKIIINKLNKKYRRNREETNLAGSEGTMMMSHAAIYLSIPLCDSGYRSLLIFLSYTTVFFLISFLKWSYKNYY